MSLALPVGFIGSWAYDAKRENAGVAASDIAHLNAAREPLLQALGLPFAYRAVVLNARKTMLDISGDEAGTNMTINVANHHYAADFDAKFENVITESWSDLVLGGPLQDITLVDGSGAQARALMVENNLVIQVHMHHIAPYALEQTYTLMDHNNAIRLNVTFGDLNLNFYYLRHQPQEI